MAPGRTIRIPVPLGVGTPLRVVQRLGVGVLAGGLLAVGPLCASVAAAGSVVVSADEAAAGVPVVGDCLDVPATDLRTSGFFATPVVVDCTRPHTFEVTRVEALAGSGDPFAFAEQACSPLGVWNEVGVNRPVAGVVRDPLSVEPRYFGVAGTPATLVCGAVAVSGAGSGQREVAVLTRPLSALSARSRADLRYCSPGDRGRRVVDVGAVGSCDDRPRWQVDAMIVWTAFYDAYPGRAELRARAQRVCGAQARAVLPSRSEWGAGPATTWCLTWYP